MKLFLSLCLLAALSFASAPSVTTLEGVLIDADSSYIAETRVVGDGLQGGMLAAYMHPKTELLKPENQKSGYGVYTYDQKFVPFDAASNAKALAFIKAATRPDNFRVAVLGKMNGDKFTVTSIKFLE